MYVLNKCKVRKLLSKTELYIYFDLRRFTFQIAQWVILENIAVVQKTYSESVILCQSS